MKKQIALFLVILLLVLSGCNFKVHQNTFNIPHGSVKSIEIQREYTAENGEPYYRCKVIDDEKQVEELCQLIREFPVKRAPGDVPNPMRATSIIVILKGKTEHRLILNSEMAFYDKAAYNYEKESTFSDFISLYEELNIEEVDTEAKPF